MKYPNIIFFRYEKYSYIDLFFEDKNLLCSLQFTSEKKALNNLFDPNYHILITFGESDAEYCTDVYSEIPTRMNHKWIHFKDITNIDDFNRGVNFCYINNINYINSQKEITRVTFSIFTTCYNSYDKIYLAYNSIKNQTFKDWEWVILDDSPNDEHFEFLKKLTTDKRIRLYKRSENSGNIGNVKNETVSLCRGKYVLELDHDDEILPCVLADSVKVFDDENVGFIYMNFTNIYENGANFNYGNFFGLGYEGYYMEKYKGRWIYVASSANINNITLSHIVSVPNHPRIWRMKTLMQMGNYSEFLPICDDYELLLRTAINTKMVKINKLGYVQYMNNNNNNFSLIRNSEINRLCPHHLFPQCYKDYKINDKMKELDAYDDPKYTWGLPGCSQVWKRHDYVMKYCNDLISPDYTKIYCIIGAEYLNIDRISELYKDIKNDFLVLDNKCTNEELCKIIDDFGFSRMKCYSMTDCSTKELENYFHLIYKSLDQFEIIGSI